MGPDMIIVSNVRTISFCLPSNLAYMQTAGRCSELCTSSSISLDLSKPLLVLTVCFQKMHQKDSIKWNCLQVRYVHLTFPLFMETKPMPQPFWTCFVLPPVCCNVIQPSRNSKYCLCVNICLNTNKHVQLTGRNQHRLFSPSLYVHVSLFESWNLHCLFSFGRTFKCSTPVKYCSWACVAH